MAAATEGSEVVIAGMGGQGAQLIGKLLAELLMPHYRHVTWFPVLSPFMRGSPTECTVVFSQEEISSPIVDNPAAAVVMDQYSFDLYVEKMAPGSALIMDASIIKEKVKRDDIRVLEVPATEMARELGSEQAANFVLLGVYLKAEEVLPMETVLQGLSEKLSQDGKEKFMELNAGALRKGWELVS